MANSRRACGDTFSDGQPTVMLTGMTDDRTRRPGDIILDRLSGPLDHERRVVARERLKAYTRWLLQVAIDEVQSTMDTDSRFLERGSRMDSPSPP